VLDLFTTAALRDALSARARVRAMLDVERALAAAQAKSGVIPSSAAAACDVQMFDLEPLARQSIAAGSLAIPLARRFTQAVAVSDPAAARYVHWGRPART